MVKAKLPIVLAMLALVASCSRGTTQKSASSSAGLYLSKEMSASFRVPSGWAEPKSWNPLSKKGSTVRFDSPDRAASITAVQAPFAGINCAAAAKEALATANGASLDVDGEFELKANLDDLQAGAGRTSSSKRQGLARYFCRGKSVVVLEAGADRSAFAKKERDLEAIVDSFNYDSAGEQVAIRQPAGPKEPTFLQHTVKRGQTLGQIAEWYTGEYDNWKKLSRYNEDAPVPNVALKAGRTIKIPVELVIKQEPMPEPKRKRTERKQPATPKTAQKPAEAESAAAPKEAPSAAASEEEEAETTDVPKAVEEEALPPVIGPR